MIHCRLRWPLQTPRKHICMRMPASQGADPVREGKQYSSICPSHPHSRNSQEPPESSRNIHQSSLLLSPSPLGLIHARRRQLPEVGE